MKVLITGATGFVGSRLCELLDSGGHAMHILSRDLQKAREAIPGATVFEWAEPTRTPAPVESFQGVDAVVHLAGEKIVGPWTREKKQKIRDSRIFGTRNLVSAMAGLAKRPGVLLSASAIGYYGDRGEELLREDAEPGNDFTAEVSRGWEKEAQKAEALGIRVIRIRIGIVLGPGNGALEAMLLPFKMGVGGPIGSGKQWWSWVQLDDLCKIGKFLLERDDLNGAFNATAPDPVRQKDFAKNLAGKLNRPAVLPTPAFLVRTVLGGFSEELLASRRAIPERLQQAGFQFDCPDLDSALERSLS